MHALGAHQAVFAAGAASSSAGTLGDEATWSNIQAAAAAAAAARAGGGEAALLSASPAAANASGPCPKIAFSRIFLWVPSDPNFLTHHDCFYYLMRLLYDKSTGT